MISKNPKKSKKNAKYPIIIPPKKLKSDFFQESYKEITFLAFKSPTIFRRKLKCWQKKKQQMLSSKFCHLRRLVFDQSPPVHPVSGSKGETLSVTHERTKYGNPCV